MLTHEDIKNLSDYQKEIFATKEDIKHLDAKFDVLLTSVDNYAKKADTYFQEMVVLSNKVNRHERWFHLIADKLNIKLEY